MELLIPGLILVALMVWASTRIKRDAEDAFRPETIETDEFIFHKPDGYLHVLNDNTGLALRAYSREYGTGDNSGTRRSVIEVERFSGAPDQRFADLLSAGVEASDVRKFLDNGQKAIVFRHVDPDQVRYYKLVSSGEGLFEVRVIEIPSAGDESELDAESVLASFRSK